MKVLVINLRRSTERRAHMARQLRRLAVDFEFVEAVDGAAMTPESLAQATGGRAAEAGGYRRSVVACAWSHVLAYRKIAAGEDRFGLVLEDDIVVDRRLMELLPELTARCREGEIVLLRYFSNRNGGLELTTVDARPVSEGYRLLSPVDPDAVASAGAYLLSRDTAASMRDALFPIRHVADDWAGFVRVGACSGVRCLHPQPVGDAPFATTIAYPATATRVHRLKGMVRRILHRVPGALALLGAMAGRNPRHEIMVTDRSPGRQPDDSGTGPGMGPGR